jgi:hypothetical protein
MEGASRHLFLRPPFDSAPPPPLRAKSALAGGPGCGAALRAGSGSRALIRISSRRSRAVARSGGRCSQGDGGRVRTQKRALRAIPGLRIETRASLPAHKMLSRVGARRDDQSGEGFAEAYWDRRGLKAERFTPGEIGQGKTPDFRVFKSGELVAFCEAKHAQHDDWLDKKLEAAKPLARDRRRSAARPHL